MALAFKLPDLGEGLTEAEIVKWLVRVGDALEEGQAFVQVETNKAIIEIPSPRKGAVLQLGAAEGETVPVGKVIIIIGERGEEPEVGVRPEKAEEHRRHSVGVVGELEEAQHEPTARFGREEEKVPAEIIPAPAVEKGALLAVPMVRKMASALKLDLRTIKGTGPQGRITKEDVLKAGAKKPAEKEVLAPEIKAPANSDSYGFIERVPPRGLRKKIARVMAKSKSTIPHAAGIDEADVTQLIDLKTKAKERAASKRIHLTFLPFMIKAVVAALQEHPYLNASFDDESSEIILKKYYNSLYPLTIAWWTERKLCAL